MVGSAGSGTIDLPPDAPLHLWATDVDGTPLVATLAIGIPDDEELFVAMAGDILATIRSG